MTLPAAILATLAGIVIGIAIERARRDAERERWQREVRVRLDALRDARSDVR